MAMASLLRSFPYRAGRIFANAEHQNFTFGRRARIGASRNYNLSSLAEFLKDKGLPENPDDLPLSSFGGIYIGQNIGPDRRLTGKMKLHANYKPTTWSAWDNL